MPTSKQPRIVWKRNARGGGSLGHPTGWTMKVRGKVTATVNFAEANKTFYWVAGWDSEVPHFNSICNLKKKYKTDDDAKLAAETYVRERLAVIAADAARAVPKAVKPTCVWVRKYDHVGVEVTMYRPGRSRELTRAERIVLHRIAIAVMTALDEDADVMMTMSYRVLSTRADLKDVKAILVSEGFEVK